MRVQRAQIGTVRILKDRKYRDVMVPLGIYPVYIDVDDSIYWEMAGYPVKWESGARIEKIEGIGDHQGSMLMVYPPRGDVIVDTAAVSVRSQVFTVEEFNSFVSDDILCRRGPECRLQFEFLAYPLYPDGCEMLSELTSRLAVSSSH